MMTTARQYTGAGLISLVGLLAGGYFLHQPATPAHPWTDAQIRQYDAQDRVEHNLVEIHVAALTCRSSHPSAARDCARVHSLAVSIRHDLDGLPESATKTAAILLVSQAEADVP